MSQQLPENSDSQQADISTPQNVVQGNQNRAVQGNENQGVLGKNNTVVQGNNNTQNIHITNYYYREDIRVVPIKSAQADDENLPCPYRGLFHFSPDDAQYFFGREVFIEELFTATKIRNFITVLGASGSGKSSVVLAGLVPKLQQEGHWLFTHFRPSSEPFYALAQALIPLYEPEKNATEQMYQARQLAEYFVNGSVPLKDVFTRIQRNYANHRVLLIADQFEELYTLCSDEKIRRSFQDTLLAGFQSESNQFPSSYVLVSTMRVDFLGNALAYPPFADVLHNADIKIRSMNRSELSDVIAKPAQKLKVTFQDGLLERILDDVEDEPGNLPLLEFALTLLWERRTGKQLTHKSYREIGKVQGALTNYADKKYKELNYVEQQQTRQIFIQLVSPGNGAKDTRRLATKEELGKENWYLVKRLADARLVVTSQNTLNQETVEVVHEALIQNWNEFLQWMTINRDFRNWQERLRLSIRQWKEMYEVEGLLLQGFYLKEANNWKQIRSHELSIDDLKFISLSHKTAQKQRQLRNLKTYFLGITIIPSLILIINTRLRPSILRVARQNLTESAISKGERIRDVIAILRATLLTVSKTTVIPSGSPIQEQEILTQLKQQLPASIECIQLTNLLSHKIVASSCGDKAIGELRLPLSSDGINVKAIFPPKAGITGKRNTENQLRLVLSAPVSDSRRNLVYSLSIQSALYQQTINPPGSLTGAMVVIAEDGTILAHPFTNWVGTNINQHPNAFQLKSIIKHAIAGQNNSINLFFTQGTELIAGYTAIANPLTQQQQEKWIVLAVTSVDNALFGLEEIKILLFMIVCSLIWIIVTNFIFKKID